MEVSDEKVDLRKTSDFPWSVYILYSIKFNRKYVGMSASVDTRFAEHNSGRVKSTKGYCPWTLIYQESCTDRTHARERETYWKSGGGRKKIKAMIDLFNSKMSEKAGRGAD